MEIEFPLLEITPELEKVIGLANPGTRFYHAEGADGDVFRAWWDVLATHCPGGLTSPGGAGRYAGVSRAAVHKAMKEGRITAFAFHETKKVKGVFGLERARRGSPYVYLPVFELKGWFNSLRGKIERLREEQPAIDPEDLVKRVQAELEGKSPDWVGRFYDAFPKQKKKKG